MALRAAERRSATVIFGPVIKDVGDVFIQGMFSAVGAGELLVSLDAPGGVTGEDAPPAVAPLGDCNSDIFEDYNCTEVNRQPGIPRQMKEDCGHDGDHAGAP